MNPRPYQLDSIAQLREAFKTQRRVVLCLPTGAGKSLIFSKIAIATAESGKHVLILTHRTELKQQAETYQQGATLQGRLDVQMVETFWNLLKRSETSPLEGYNLLIIDEAHIGNFRKIIEAAPPSLFIIGATATPISKPKMSEYFGGIVSPVSISGLIAEGYLCRAKYYVSKLVDDFTALEARGDDYTIHSQESVFNTSKVRGGIVRDFQEAGLALKKVIIFCSSIKASIELADELSITGASVYCVHSKMPNSEREAIFSAYKAAEVGTLVNCGIATTGFDCPNIQVVILNRATMSLALYHQMVGRGSRPHFTKQGEFTVWDYGQNIARLGFWERPINWVQIFHEPERIRPAMMSVTKQCDQCAAFIASSARNCKYCGFVFPVTITRVLDGKLEPMGHEDIKRLDGRGLYSLNTRELAELVAYKGYKKAFYESVLYHSGKRAELDAYWRAKGYQRGYIARRLDSLSCQRFGDRVVRV